MSATSYPAVVKVKAKDEQAVYDHYNNAWADMRDVLARALKAESGHLARAMNLAMAARAVEPRKQRGRFLPHIAGAPLSDAVGQACHLAYYSAVVLEAIRTRMPETTQRVIEMGSGWSAIIASLWLSGAPKDAEYWALEYTQSGRDATALLAAAEPAFRLFPRAFDYHQPDFSEMKEPLETIVYSIYSIEQISFIKDELIDRILAIPGFKRCIHVEPVGWQVDPNSFSARLDRIVKKLGMAPLSQDAASARRCWRHGKNRNLLETLRRYEREGKIVIETVVKDLVANDPLNPGTLISWRKA